MKKAVQDLIVSGFGMATSVMTAIILAIIETKLNFAFYSITWWFVIPVGALLSGVAAASGYYWGARVFHHRPTGMFIFNVISVAVTTYFLLYYLEYRFLDVDGQPASELVSFGQYMDLVIGHQSLRVRTVNVGEIGNFGYALAVLQILGFAVGGFAVFVFLRAAPFCKACSKYLQKVGSVVRYTNDADELAVAWADSASQLRRGNVPLLTGLWSSVGESKDADRHIRATVKFWRCSTCPEEFIDLILERSSGNQWTQISDFHVRGPLPQVQSLSPLPVPVDLGGGTVGLT